MVRVRILRIEMAEANQTVLKVLRDMKEKTGLGGGSR
nr:MAG TPA_asm: hypothetical protein [Caudoviricetes sp.]